MNKGSRSIVLRKELDLGATSSSSCFNVSSTVRKQSFVSTTEPTAPQKLVLTAQMIDLTFSNQSSLAAKDHSCPSDHIPS
jgi:hypothetical protein